LNAIVLPKVFLEGSYDVNDSADRGVKTIDEIDGRSIIYEPNLAARKYIKQYILSERSGKKCIVCKYSDNVQYIDYDVVLFDEFGETFKVINVEEIVKGNHISDRIEIPNESCFATIMVHRANDEESKQSAMKTVSSKKIAAYVILSALSIIIATSCVKLCCAELLGGLFDEIFMVSIYSTLVTVIVCVVLVALNVVSAIFIIKSKNKKIKGGRENA
jgi:hypothetical protein